MSSSWKRTIACAMVVACVSTPLLAGDKARNGQSALVPHVPADSRMRASDNGFVVPPTSGHRPMSVYVHGMCGRAEVGCPFIAEHSTRWMLCPKAPLACSGGGSSWAGVQDLIARVQKTEGAASDADVSVPRVWIGFSQGGYQIASLIQARVPLGPVLILGADVRPSLQDLSASRITKLAIGAGQGDATYVPLRQTAGALQKAGMNVRFVDLGPVGHTYVPKAPETLRDTLSWLENDLQQF